MTAQGILNVLGFPESELSIVLTDDREISELNEKYLHRTGPTNVIAFPMQEGEFADITPGLLGDVVVSVETAMKESADARISLNRRTLELLVHGILHLVGYDHENSVVEALRMENKTRQILDEIEIQSFFQNES